MATALAFLPALGCGFVWDDLSLVTGNRLTGSWSNLGAVFSTDLWSGSGVQGRVSGYYRPLQVVSLMVDRSLWGLSPAGHHLSSLAWHLLAVAALLALLRQLVGAPAALLGAALFAAHPLQVETVVWISARSGSMATALSLAGLALLVPVDVGRRRALGGGALLLAAMLCKEHAVLAPVLLLLLDLAREGRVVGRWRHVAAFAAVGLALALRVAVGVGIVGPADPAGAPLVEALARVGGTTGWQLAVPWPLTTRRHLDWSPFPVWMLAAGWTVVVGGALGVLRWGGGLARAGLAFAVLAFAPSVLAILDQHQLGDRYLYLPMAGLGVVVAAVADRLGRRALWAGLLLLPALALVGSRVPDWDTDLTLDRSAAEAEPANAHAVGAYGGRLAAAGLVEEGMEHLERAVLSGRPPAAACHGLVRVPLQGGDLPRARRAVDQVRQAGCPATSTLSELVLAVEAAGGG